MIEGVPLHASMCQSGWNSSGQWRYGSRKMNCIFPLGQLNNARVLHQVLNWWNHSCSLDMPVALFEGFVAVILNNLLFLKWCNNLNHFALYLLAAARYHKKVCWQCFFCWFHSNWKKCHSKLCTEFVVAVDQFILARLGSLYSLNEDLGNLLTLSW